MADFERGAVPGEGAELPGPASRAGLRGLYADIATAQAKGSSAGCGCFTGLPAARDRRAGAAGGAYLGPGFAGPQLGSGNPLALAELRPGETVLDLGSGAGMDCFLAAGQVGDEGRVIGVDMTPEMIDAARANRVKMGVSNVEFRLGEIEHLPVADASVDVVLSNCTINLCGDRAQVFREAWRVLRPGGRLAVSDVMLDGPVPDALKAAIGDAAASLVEESDYLAAVRSAGFVGVTLERTYPDPGIAAEYRPRAASGAAALAVVRVGETGETRTIALEESDARAIGRSFSGSLLARKPG